MVRVRLAFIYYYLLNNVSSAEQDAKTNIEEKDALNATSDEDTKAKSADTKHVTEDEKQVSEVVASVTSQ